MPADFRDLPAVDVAAARRETLRYHRELYAEARLGEQGTWLEQPHETVLEAIDRLDAHQAASAYDLGAGVGRHTVVMGRRVPPGSIIAAVDVLPSALRRLRSNMRPTGVRARTRCVDLVNFSFDGPAYLVVAFSAIEHLPGLSAIADLLGKIARAPTPGGIAAVGVLADRFERAPGGERHPAPLESAITSEAARWALGQVPAERALARPGRQLVVVLEVEPAAPRPGGARRTAGIARTQHHDCGAPPG